jgi:hypothetical protein
MGTVGLAVANKNPGNTRSTILGNGIVVDTVKGKFVRYPRLVRRVQRPGGPPD